MKIAFIFQKDSHFKAVHATALRLCEQYKCKPVFIGIDTDYHPKGSKKLSYLQRDNLDCLVDYDYVVACLGGYLLNFVIRRLASNQTKVISIFPGIVSHYQLDAFISRLNADQVWLNSRADYEFYSKICKVLRVKNNGLLYGMSWIKTFNAPRNKPSRKRGYKHVIFFEQTNIPNIIKNKESFKRKVTLIFAKNQKTFFQYKVRDNTELDFFIKLRQDVDKHENVQIVKDLDCQDIQGADLYLSISSSAIIEGLVYNKSVALISRHLADTDSREFFKGSGLYLKDTHLYREINANDKWMRYRVKKPERYVVLKSIKKRDLSKPYNRKLIYYTLIGILFFIRPTISLQAITNKERVFKSIDYFNYGI